MVLVDGVDGYLAASTVRRAAFGDAKAKSASRLLGLIIVIFAFSLGGAELFGLDLARIAFPLGLSLFVVVIGIRFWARSSLKPQTWSWRRSMGISPVIQRGNPAPVFNSSFDAQPSTLDHVAEQR